jgi:hypothetical protein
MPRLMGTALALVQAECANWQTGRCLGADLYGNFCMPLPACLLKLRLPCSYFDDCLLPLALRRRDCAQAVAAYCDAIAGDLCILIEQVEDAELRELVRRHPFCRHSAKWAQRWSQGVKERRCACGAVLAKRKQLCAKCAKERRRGTNRREKRRQRSIGVSCPTNNVRNSPETGLEGAKSETNLDHSRNWVQEPKQPS